MPATWKQLTFTPSSEALAALRKSWGWLVSEAMEPFMCSASGDVFYEAPDRGIHWLDTGQGQFTPIAANRDEFLEAMRSDNGAEWILSPVIDKLFDAGQSLRTDQCFAFKVLPILGGTYSIENMVPMSAASWYGFSGYAHNEIKDLPEGAQVSFKLHET